MCLRRYSQPLSLRRRTVSVRFHSRVENSFQRCASRSLQRNGKTSISKTLSFKLEQVATRDSVPISSMSPQPSATTYLDTFFRATGMAENHSKRDYIALGTMRTLDMLTLPGNIVCDPISGTRTNTSWTKDGDYTLHSSIRKKCDRKLALGFWRVSKVIF